MRTPDDIVRMEVHYCVSALVSTLAQGYGHPYPTSRQAYGDDLPGLIEQAFELACPVDDWQEALFDQFEIRHDVNGFYWLTTEEAAIEDAGNPSVGFDGRDHFNDAQSAARDCCEHFDIEPYQWEVYEHWIVSDWLADHLEARGEKIDRDFAGMIVWARTTSGQGIASDSVIVAIADDLNRANG